MALKYKIGDEVVLGENVEPTYGGYFTPNTVVRISELCSVDGPAEHYTVHQVDGKGGAWWVNDDEINHKATEELQKSNETGDIVGKTGAVSDDNDQEVQTPVLEGNAPQTALQSLVAVYNSVSVLHKSSSEEAVKITIKEGEFLVFQQEYDGSIQEIILDFNAVGAVFSAANELIVQYKEKK